MKKLLFFAFTAAICTVAFAKAPVIQSQDVVLGEPSVFGYREMTIPGRTYAPKVKLNRKASASCDWRNKDFAAITGNWMTTVKNQAACGSCYSFAMMAHMESKIKMWDNGTLSPDPDLSENNLKNAAGGCSGGNGWISMAFLSSHGFVTEADDPYHAYDEAYTEYTPTITPNQWYDLSGISREALKTAIETFGPVYTSMYAGDSTGTTEQQDWLNELSSYDGSYVLDYAGNPTGTNHAVMIVGWHDTDLNGLGVGGWIVRNSWGPSWGDNGYFYIKYDNASGNPNAYIQNVNSQMDKWHDYRTGEKCLSLTNSMYSSALGFGSPEAWYMVKITPDSSTDIVDCVETWTNDITTDVDFYLYDDFDGSATSILLGSVLNQSYSYAGYVSADFSSQDIALTSGDPVYVVIHVTNSSYNYPMPLNANGTDPKSNFTNSSYMSSNGGANYVAIDLGYSGSSFGDSVARIRTIPDPNGVRDWSLY